MSNSYGGKVRFSFTQEKAIATCGGHTSDACVSSSVTLFFQGPFTRSAYGHSVFRIPYYGCPVQLLRFRLGLERDLAAVAMSVRPGAILR